MGTGGEPTGQQTSGEATLSAAASRVELLTWRGGETSPTRQIRLECDAGSTGAVAFIMRRRWLDHEHEHTVHLGPGGAVVLPLSGAVDVLCSSTLGARVRWGIQREPEPAPWPGAVDAFLELAPGAASSVGAWVDVGWAPSERVGLCLYPSSEIELRYLDTGGAQRALWSQSAPIGGLSHPPRLKLQARHPGGDAIPRSVVAVWTRGS